MTYIISLCVYGLDDIEAFAPKQKSLALLGWKDARKIKNNYQVWRLLTPTFLHGNAYHIIANLTAQTFLGNGIEAGIGTYRMIFLYFVTGIGGMLLSSIYKPESFAIGCSTSVFGLVGYYVSYIITGWWYMGREAPG